MQIDYLLTPQTIHSMSICALCLENKTLSNSHIVPDFIFKKLLKDDGRYSVVRQAGGIEKTFEVILEEKLLCADCESHFSLWETYATPFFEQVEQSTPKNGTVIVGKIDYAKMKLFLMSILWRFSVTTIPWLKGLHLGSHSDRLRKYLLASDPVEHWRYGSAAIFMQLNGEAATGIMFPPWPINQHGRTLVRIGIGGVLFIFNVSSHDPKAGTDDYIKEDGTMKMFVKEIRDIPYLAHAINKMDKSDWDNM